MRKIFLFLFLLTAFRSIAAATDLRSDSIDIVSFDLKIDVTDFAGRNLKGDASIKIKGLVNGVNSIRLDLLKLTVDSVKRSGVTTSFLYNDSTLQIPFSPILNQFDSTTVEVFYHGTPLQEAGDFGGFFWNTSHAFNIGVSFISDPHNYGRVWFPCFDNFRERSLFSFHITTKDFHKAFCNGLFQGVTTQGNTKTWNWQLHQEIPSYLASIAVAAYQTLYDTVQGIGGVKPVELAARNIDTASMRNLFVHLPDAFHIQEGLWGEYKWDRVGYCIVPFTAGAMEHATNIFFMNYYLNQLSDDCEDAMVHELSHHWFGNLVTCDSASEMWLNEGWARYNEMLFHEQYYGADDYRFKVREKHEYVLHQSHVRDGAYLPVSGVPTLNTYGSTVYDKGSEVIHTMRSYMGDSLFFHCVKNYITDFSWKNASTAQLRDYLSQCSGISLNDYFADWVYAPGFPHFSVENRQVQYTPSIQNYTVEFTIRQQLHQAPHYYNNVPLQISYFDAHGNSTTETVMVSGECTHHVVQSMTPYEPVYIALDFDEKLQDAITDEWKMIDSTGSYDFGTAKLIMNVSNVSNTNLVRVEHNWIRPEPMKTKIDGLHLHDKRYWTIDGVFQPNWMTDARFDYDGTDISLDKTFFTNAEDSLVMMYRAYADSEWVVVSTYTVNKGVNASDKKGYITVSGAAKGQYCMAMLNAAIIDTTLALSDCVYSSIPETVTSNNWQMFPNPTVDWITVRFASAMFNRLMLYDLPGRIVQEQTLNPVQTQVQIPLHHLQAGIYLLTITDYTGQKITKRIVKQ